MRRRGILGCARTVARGVAWGFAAVALLAFGAVARAQDSPPLSGDEIVRRVNARDDGDRLSRTIVMELTDRGGDTRTRVTRSFRRRFGDDVRSVLFFDEPRNVQGTGLLTWDYADPARTDDQWLYLPALRKSRRVALADRGRAFLGTDLSFEDMKKETRVNSEDYAWQAAGEETVDGHRCVVVEGVAVDEDTARETGYGRLRMRVDAATWIPRLLEYWGPDGAALKTVRLREIESIEGIETPRRVEAENLQTGHRTVLRFEQVDYGVDIPDDLFTEAALRRGAP